MIAFGTAPVSTSDWVLIGSTLVLAVTAFLTPLINDWVKNRWHGPKLSIGLSLAPPACHLTDLHLRVSPSQVFKHKAYYFRLHVENKGGTQAKRCEMVVESVARADSAGRFQPFPRYTPVNLIWGSSYGEFVDINPGRRFYCDFISVPDEGAQKLLDGMGAYVNAQDAPEPTVGAVLSTKTAFFSQPNRLPPGRYRIQLALFCETADTHRATFTLSWTGQWQPTEEAMFQELVIE